MPRWRRKWGPFVPVGNGRFDLNLDDDDRRVLANLLSEMGDTLDATGRPELRRLYPTAYPDDPDRDAEYQGLMRNELQTSHQAAVDRVVASLEQDQLDETDLEAWLRTLNAARLVLGTRLEVSEDTDPAEGLFVPPEPGDPGPARLADSPDAMARFAYLWLSELLESAVAAAAHDLR